MATTADFYLWPLMFFTAMTLVVVTAYDIDHMIIPHEFVYTLLGLVVWYLVYGWWNGSLEISDIGWRFLAGVGASGFFYALWWYSGGRWLGLGDAKLAFPLAMMVGVSLVFSLVVLAFWIGAIISLTIILYQQLKKRGQTHLRFLSTPLTIKSEVPFAPFLVLSFVCTFWFGVNVLDWFVYAF